jgi:hypothetical protein
MWSRTELIACLDRGQVVWRRHALERMLERGITRDEVLTALRNGTVIEQYPGDRPMPSPLIHHGEREPVHVITAVDVDLGSCYVITVYRPDRDHFGPDLKTRRTP